MNEYLANSGSLQETPVKRLNAMNFPALQLYLEHGIDLASEPLEIGICAQHNNGGLKGNIWWESDLKHLFPVGEVNGSHGVHRPGGSALNSGQVGSYRAAQYISRKYNTKPPDKSGFLSGVMKETESLLQFASHILSRDTILNKKILSEIRERMSENGSIIRDGLKIKQAVKEADLLFKNFRELAGAATVKELAGCFRIYDNCLTHMIYLDAIKTYIEKGGRSRGSYLVVDREKDKTSWLNAPGWKLDLCLYDREVESKILEVGFRDGNLQYNLVNTREIPVQNLWFEKVWKDYMEDKFIDG